MHTTMLVTIIIWIKWKCVIDYIQLQIEIDPADQTRNSVVSQTDSMFGSAFDIFRDPSNFEFAPSCATVHILPASIKDRPVLMSVSEAQSMIWQRNSPPSTTNWWAHNLFVETSRELRKPNNGVSSRWR